MDARETTISEEIADYKKNILQDIVLENKILSEDDIKISWKELNLKQKQKYKVQVHDINGGCHFNCVMS